MINKIEEFFEAIKEFATLCGWAILIGFIYYSLGLIIWQNW